MPHCREASERGQFPVLPRDPVSQKGNTHIQHTTQGSHRVICAEASPVGLETAGKRDGVMLFGGLGPKKRRKRR